MKFDVGVVEDGGEFWVISKVISCDLLTLDLGEQYVRLSSEAAKEVKAALEVGFLVQVPKDLGREVQVVDLNIKQLDELTAKKQVAKSLVNKFFNTHLEALSIIDIYAYTAIFSKFAARGIFITDENVDKVRELYTVRKEDLKDRDDAYVDIILSNSEEDLQDLQELVDAQDKMKRVYEIYKKVKETEKSIEVASSVDEVEKVRNDFFHSVMFPGV